MKLLLTADLHIRNQENLSLLQRIIDTANGEGCKAILIGGDLLDSPFPDEQTERALLSMLKGAGLPILMVAGNHDPLDLTDCYRKLPENVKIFQETLSSLSLGEGVEVYGFSDTRGGKGRHFSKAVATEGSGVKILMAHGQPDGADGSYFPISTAAVAESGFSLALLGHVHKWEQRTVGGCRILLPGIPEGRGWDEQGERFIWIAAVRDGAIELSPKKIAGKTYMEYEVDLTDCDEEEALSRMEAQEIPASTEGRLILVGAPAADPAPAIRLYTEKYGRAVKDCTEQASSMALLMKQNTLQGAYVRRAMAEIEQAEGEERALLEEALHLGLRALRGGRR